MNSVQSDASKIEEGIRSFFHMPPSHIRISDATLINHCKQLSLLPKGHDRRVGLFAKILDFRNILYCLASAKIV